MAAQSLAWRLRLPAVVLRSALGFLAGPVCGVSHPAASVGSALQPAVGLAAALVAFRGGLALAVRALRSAGAGVLRPTVVALPIDRTLGTLAARRDRGDDRDDRRAADAGADAAPQACRGYPGLVERGRTAGTAAGG